MSFSSFRAFFDMLQMLLAVGALEKGVHEGGDEFSKSLSRNVAPRCRRPDVGVKKARKLEKLIKVVFSYFSSQRYIPNKQQKHPRDTNRHKQYIPNKIHLICAAM